MESLKYDDVKKEYPEVIGELQEKFPDATFEGKPFEIESDFVKEIILLKINGEPFYFTRSQALDLSYGLSREAKRIVKRQRKSQK
jgi:hypothetical protein